MRKVHTCITTAIALCAALIMFVSLSISACSSVGSSDHKSASGKASNNMS